MTLRHIEARTVEWYEAVMSGYAEEEGLGPEEWVRLRTLRAMESRTMGLPDGGSRQREAGAR